MRVFLDVGTHEGQTLEEVTKRRWAFDRILGFEPARQEFNTVSKRFASQQNVVVHNFALGQTTGPGTLYGSNEQLGSSLLRNYSKDGGKRQEPCAVVRASEFFRNNIRSCDVNVAKLNCEGSEVAILDDLISSREIMKLSALMIDFDIRKVSYGLGEDQRIMNELEAVGFSNYVLAEEAMLGPTHQVRIRNWLKGTGLFPTRRREQIGDVLNSSVHFVIQKQRRAANKLRRGTYR